MNGTDHESVTAGLPPWHSPQSWISLTAAARYFKRNIRTVERWCHDGTFHAFGIRVYRDVRGRYWVCIPDRNDANSDI